VIRPGSKPLLRIESGNEWSLDLDSSTALGAWKKARTLGAISQKAKWQLSSNRSEAIPNIQILNPELDDLNNSQLLPVAPHAEPQGWAWESEPLFFDNGSIQVEIVLPADARNPRIFHFSRAVCDRFVCKSSKADAPLRLIGLLEFGNDLGDFELAWEWESPSGNRKASLRGTVYSTKLDLTSDFKAMLKGVENRFEGAVRLDILRQTHWNILSSTSPATLQSWLSVFRQLEHDLFFAFQRLIRCHRQTLKSEVEWVRAEGIRKMSPAREESIARGIKERPNKLFHVEKGILDPDRIENRFAKHVLTSIIADLERAKRALDGRTQVSDIFREWIESRHGEWAAIGKHPFWRGISAFHGFHQESLVIHRDPTYSRIVEGWSILRKGLSLVLSERFQGGIQTVDDLYEIWCLVQLDQAILDLGWSSSESTWSNGGIGWDDLGTKPQAVAARLVYENSGCEGERIEMLYQPSANVNPSKAKGWEGIHSLPVTQRPDIVIRHHKNGYIRTWIFDAKYRVEIENSTQCYAPHDAINQMHRYRDAILWAEDSAIMSKKHIREGIGAFVLFPGHSIGWTEHLQNYSISQVNIGAFPLRPTWEDGSYITRGDGFNLIRELIKAKTTDLGWLDGLDPSTPQIKTINRTEFHTDISFSV